jgi:stage IV sporulation protein FB
VFFEPTQTQFDLRFRLFGIAVRVHPMFWVIMAVLGWGGGPRQEQGAMFLLSVLAWVVACFVSILIHEMGHVFMGRMFGSDGHIVLYGFGGLAIGSNALASGAKRALVAFAGPLAQFLLLAGVVVVIWLAIIPAQLRPLITADWNVYDRLELLVALSPYNAVVLRFLEGMLFINLFWPLLNLLPIWPLDGGQIAREGCVGMLRERGLRLSLGISILVAGLLAIIALSTIRNANGDPLIPILGRDKPLIPIVGGLFAGGWFMVLLFVMLAVQNIRLLQAIEAQQRWHDEHWQD